MVTHNLLTHNLHSHNLLTHNLLTHNLLSHHLITHLLSHNLLTHTTSSHTTSSHTTYSHTTYSHPPSLCVAGVALGDIDVHSPWQAWHLWHWAGSGGALGSHLVPWARPLFAWQRWHLATSTCTLRGRCGTYGTGLALVARLVPSGRRCRRGCLRGRPGTWRHRPALCVAAVALMALGWLWWRAWFPFGAVGAAAVCIAGVALMALDWLWWRAWAPDCQTVIGVLL